MAYTLISIIIPIYNVRDYITECLISVTRQTFTENIECLLIDDCGTDDSMSLVEKFMLGYKGEISFRIIKHEYNKGLSAARNFGLLNAKGEYVLFIDSDDFILPDCLQQFVNVKSLYPEAEMIVAGAMTNWTGRENDFTMEKPFPDYANNPEWISRMLLIRGGRKGIPITAWNRLVRRDFLLRHKLLFGEGMIHEDELWNFMLAQKLKRIAFCKHNTYFYRNRPQSIMTCIKDKDRHALICIPLWYEVLNHFTPGLKREQTHSLWQMINDVSPTCLDHRVRKETLGILWQLVCKGFWPTSYLILLYMMPFVFYVKFIRKQVAKLSRINIEDYNCCMS